MRCADVQLDATAIDDAALAPLQQIDPQVVLAFFSIAAAQDRSWVQTLRRACPGATLLGCSTAGEIGARGVIDGSVTLAAIRLEHSGWRSASAEVAGLASSAEAGRRLAQQLAAPDLRTVIVLAPGIDINGSALIAGMASVLGEALPICGGLAADGGAFRQTWTLLDERLASRSAVALGLYGDAIRVTHGSVGGWRPFGPVRRVTRASGNTLYEIDGEPALDIYRRYLGEYASQLPTSGLLFPFAMLGADHSETGLIRTILGIDEGERSLLLAGDVIADGHVRLMHAHTDALIDGARAAAEQAHAMCETRGDGLALLVSCVGRKLVMGGRVDDEVEAVAEVFGARATIAGFYSNGEISPHSPEATCRLHNQTMTVCFLSE